MAGGMTGRELRLAFAATRDVERRYFAAILRGRKCLRERDIDTERGPSLVD
jgi:hypothetical protein